MGGGIAMCFANAGIPVTLVEAKQEALDRGVAAIRRNYEATARKGRLTAEQVETRMGLITPSLGYDDLKDVDLVIEAAFEAMAVKKEIFAALDRVCRAGAILATNTSTLDIDEIARATNRPQDVVGMHFFSPANVMKLLENVRGKKRRRCGRHRHGAGPAYRQGRRAGRRLLRFRRQPHPAPARPGGDFIGR